MSWECAEPVTGSSSMPAEGEKNRYKWFGKKEECWLPTPDLKTRFLD